MHEILDFLISEFENENKALKVDALAEKYTIEIENISEESIVFSGKYYKNRIDIFKLINKINSLFEKDHMKTPFIIAGSNSDIIKPPSKKTINILKKHLVLLDENAHIFSNRVGYSLLKKLGCKDYNIKITKDTKDNGIDYWGILELEGINTTPKLEMLIIGQVKKYSGTVSVKEIREFIGSVKGAFLDGSFGKRFNENTPHMLQFVSTGELSHESNKLVRNCKIHLITKRHLIQMGLLLDKD